MSKKLSYDSWHLVSKQSNMKISLILLSILCLTSAHLFSQGPAHCSPDSAYVWAKNGLSLRSKPSLDSEILEIVPFGTQVSHLSDWYYNGDRAGVIDSIRLIPAILNKEHKENQPSYLSSKWVQVEVLGKKGYMFGAYLSHIKPNQQDNLNAFFFAQSDTLSHLVIDSIRYHAVTIYKNGITSSEKNSEGGASMEYIIPGKFGFSDGFALMNYYMSLDFNNNLDTAHRITSESRTTSDQTCYLMIELEDNYGMGYTITISYDGHVLILQRSGHC